MEKWKYNVLNKTWINSYKAWAVQRQNNVDLIWKAFATWT